MYGSFEGATLTGVSLFQARVGSVDFSTTTMNDVICPTGQNSDTNPDGVGSCNGQFID